MERNDRRLSLILVPISLRTGSASMTAIAQSVPTWLAWLILFGVPACVTLLARGQDLDTKPLWMKALFCTVVVAYLVFVWSRWPEVTDHI